MQFAQIIPSVPALSIVNGHPTTLSTQVAEYFGKLHKDILKATRNLIESAPELNEQNFAPVEIKDAKGELRPAYRMDRKGFVLLSMGFTGEKALKFKITYIDAFDRMEEELRNSTADKMKAVATLTPAQQLASQQAVGRRAQKTANHYQTIYRAIKLRYQIARYDQLPQDKFEDCLKFIEVVNLHTPEAAAPVQSVKEAAAPYPSVEWLDNKDCERLLDFVYEFKYLPRGQLEAIYSLLKAVRSPLAPGFYELMHSMPIGNLETILAKAGYSVKNLECYQYLVAHQA